MAIKSPISIKTRILWVNIAVVLLSFLGVFLIFNVLMNNYISSNAKSQLARVVNYQSSAEQGRPDKPATSIDLDNAPRGLFNTHPAAFELSSDYQITFPDHTSELDKEVAKNITAAFKEDQVSLGQLNNFRLETKSQTFYIESSKNDKSYLILYVDISGITNFAHSVNLLLMLIALSVIIFMAIAVTLITRRLTNPLSRLASFAMRIGRGDFRPYEGRFHDLELATLADTMNNAARQLADNEQDQKAFFQNASHELRTPLMVIKSYAEGINYDIMPAHEASQTILKETDRMSELVEDLLTLSRIDSLNKPEEYARNDLREILKDVTREQEAFASQKGLKFSYQLDKKPVYIWSNYKALRRAISNLVSNALRYAKSEIQVSCKLERGKMILVVANDGDPIAEEDLPHLFERFYKGAGGVHGIGLSIVKAVTEQHGGTAYAENKAGWVRFVLAFDNQPKKVLEKKS
ncbi:sensor histidine kinase [Lactococcus termiticola]|uniref:histidine kinase n=1 Tax=Lactococcus termiticola TaxID=2169526 RepID=A0A2R5HIT7_9LACT|nr:HAMP domain-containing sensor histidine kinase [Lactococcus termiticola]GBG96308.1 two-component system sensor histidine kinase [Lactococcus termiticola]